ncbi:MAG TPA: hypothetical protein VL742_10300 [Casimicrobiaceae bacterium]|nr:hypothetical protein [Casimicrobiaceae bacterium]
MGATRDRWAARVRRWRQSGQTAREFAAAAGVNAGTLAYWAWRLKRDGNGAGGQATRRRRRRSTAPSKHARFVELIVDRPEERSFDLELGDGRRLRIPPGFDGPALDRLLLVLTDRRG